jgi:hypothetical protein
MRQLFTSPRLENVEAVAKLLADAGIEHKVSGGRSYKAYSRRQFSYSEKQKNDDEQAAVWIIKSDDYKRARELMHELGLLEATQAPSYLPDALQFNEKNAADPQSRMLKIRIALLFILVAVAGGMTLRMLFFR